MLVNLYPALVGFGENAFGSISLISSTTAWFSYLFSLYFLSWKPYDRNPLVFLNILLLLTILFPLFDVFSKSTENLKQASEGLLPGLYVFMNYASRISLLLFSVGVLFRKELVLRIAMITLASLIFTSFSVTSYELIVLFVRDEPQSLFTLISKILDPIAIISTFLLQLYLILNRKVVFEALR
jgi:hypothetical protein